MKKLLFIAFLFLGIGAQAQDGVKVKGNSISTREIAPVWPGCEGSEADKKQCFLQNLSKHISANFKYPAEAYNNNIEGKVIVSFIINEEGKVEILKADGPNELLVAEAKRNILQIPQMKPGEIGGKPTDIKYTVPFTFSTGK